MTEVTVTPSAPAAPSELSQVAASLAAPEVVTAPVAEPVKAAEPDPKFSAKFAALAKKERDYQQRAQALKAREAALQGKDVDQATFKSDPLKALKDKYGLTYNDLTKIVLNDGKLPADVSVEQVKAEIAAFKAEQEAERQAQKKAQVDYQVQQYVASVAQTIKENASEYQFANANPEAPEIIYNMVLEHHTKTGRILPTKDALEYYEKWAEEEDAKLDGVDKRKNRFAPKAPAPSAPVKPERSVTLTNAMQTTVPAPVSRQLSVEESKRQAAKMLKWT